MSSFRKKGASAAPTRGPPPGTKPSLHNAQLLISTASASLDHLLGGGLAIGTLGLVHEDTHAGYSDALLRYFMAEGLAGKQDVFFASADEDPHGFLSLLPGLHGSDAASASASATAATATATTMSTASSASSQTQSLGQTQSDEDLKIAWRYKNLPQVQSTVGGSAQPPAGASPLLAAGGTYGHTFDLSTRMDTSSLEPGRLTTADLRNTDASQTACQGLLTGAYAALYAAVEEKCKAYSLKEGHPPPSSVLRIAIHSLASPSWPFDQSLDEARSAAIFLAAIKGLVRSTCCVCMITAPTHLFASVRAKRALDRICDTVINLKSFAGTPEEKNPAFSDYHGLFFVEKLPRLNSLVCHMPETLDLVFKLRRKGFVIEKLHLPPDLSETVSRSQGDRSGNKSTALCQPNPTKKNPLDF